jgi:hypothetical protein
MHPGHTFGTFKSKLDRNCEAPNPDLVAKSNVFSSYPLSFQTLANSFARGKNSTLLFSIVSELFAKNHPGWGGYL